MWEIISKSTDPRNICRVGRTTAVDNRSEISFTILQETLSWQPIFRLYPQNWFSSRQLLVAQRVRLKLGFAQHPVYRCSYCTTKLTNRSGLAKQVIRYFLYISEGIRFVYSQISVHCSILFTTGRCIFVKCFLCISHNDFGCRDVNSQQS